MEDKDLEKPEAAEETAVQPENVRALKEEPEKEKKVLTPEEMEKRKIQSGSYVRVQNPWAPSGGRSAGRRSKCILQRG